MSMEEQVQTLAASQALLRALQLNFSQQPELMRQESNQNFIFELRDYGDSLSVITNFVETPKVELTAVDLRTLLGEQRQLIIDIIASLKQEETAFNQGEGAIRRILMSLEGAVEVNRLLVQDYAKVSPMTMQEGLVEITEEPEKKGFFKRLFSK